MDFLHPTRPSPAIPRTTPWIEKLTAETLLRGFYALPRTPHLEIRGMEHIPSGEAAVFLMAQPSPAHFIPFLYALYKHRSTRYPAFWAPSSFYEHRFFRMVLPHLNALPVPSFGEVIAEAFTPRYGRPPAPAEVAELLELVTEAGSAASPTVSRFVEEIAGGDFPAWIAPAWEGAVSEYLALARRAMVECNLNVLAFGGMDCALGDTPLDKALGSLTAILEERILLPVAISRVEGNEFNTGDALVFQISPPVQLPDPAGLSREEDSLRVPDFWAIVRQAEDLARLAWESAP